MNEKKKLIGLSILVAVLLISAISLHIRTGFFSGDSRIDFTDLNYWEFNPNGVIKGAEEFEIPGRNETCWLLIHSYASSPKEFRELGVRINAKTNDSVFAPRLEGHGELPSQILELSLDDWYLQMLREYAELENKCEKINLVGSSFGGAISTRMAEEKLSKINHVYLVNPYYSTSYRWYYLLPPDTYLKALGNIVKFNKKSQIAQINSEEGKERHVAYWNMPYTPIVNSFDFLELTLEKIEQITVPITIIHSKNDKTASYKDIKQVFDRISSKDKKMVWLNESNHLILLDYQSEEAINEIIN